MPVSKIAERPYLASRKHGLGQAIFRHFQVPVLDSGHHKTTETYMR